MSRGASPALSGQIVYVQLACSSDLVPATCAFSAAIGGSVAPKARRDDRSPGCLRRAPGGPACRRPCDRVRLRARGDVLKLAHPERLLPEHVSRRAGRERDDEDGHNDSYPALYPRRSQRRSDCGGRRRVMRSPVTGVTPTSMPAGTSLCGRLSRQAAGPVPLSAAVEVAQFKRAHVEEYWTARAHFAVLLRARFSRAFRRRHHATGSRSVAAARSCLDQRRSRLASDYRAVSRALRRGVADKRGRKRPFASRTGRGADAARSAQAA